MATDKELSDFLKSVEKRAFKRTAYTVRNDDAALDIVQDSMIRLAEKYADRPAAELPLVFQRILSNATMDWFRRQKVRNALFVRTCRTSRALMTRVAISTCSSCSTRPAAGRAPKMPPTSVGRMQILQLIDSRGCSNCRRVNGKHSCYVTGKNWMSRRPRRSWAARKAV